ncbi:MAG: molybdopterin molybdenumtransferase MoeA [Rhizobiales bacterium 35-68-8]|nr:MAG: molybdopterin molybdenumtransferase MoeA [Rhizobiales bacterium 35-68-8]
MALMTVDAALAAILADAAPLEAETVAIADAHGRVLAGPLKARRSQPEADMSAMDGYAVRADDLEPLPSPLTVIGESAAGRPYAGEVPAGAAVRIFTGALVPAGANTVVIQENTTRDGDHVTLVSPTAPGRNIRKAGFDFVRAAPLLPAGRILDARALMLAAAADHGSLQVHRRPRVAILQTGDELTLPGGDSSDPARVIVSNVYGLAALARRAGAEVTDLGIVRDSLDATRAAIRGAAEAGFDVLVTSGGASVGEHDLMAPALKAENIDLSVHKIALRPGKPLMFGQGQGLRVLGLPGNPVSAYVCGMIFLLPLLSRLRGLESHPPRLKGRLGVDMKANDMRRDYMRARMQDGADGIPVITPLPMQDSSMLSALAEADCLLIREAHAPEARAGDPCEALRMID